MLPKHWPYLSCFLAIAVTSTLAQAQAVASQMTIAEPSAVTVAESLSKSIDAVTSRVKECIATKAAPPQLCFCRYPLEVNSLRTRYQAALAKFPSWQGKVLNWTPPNQNGSRTISMAGLDVQLKQPCPK